NWYVDYQNGTNSNTGSTPVLAVKTIEYLVTNNFIQPNDTVLIIGQYNNPSYNPNFTYGGNSDRNNPHIWHGENTIKLNNLNGAPNQNITIKPFDTTTVLKGDGANIFRITNCSYLNIKGFEISGEVNQIPVSTAEGLLTDGLQFLYLAANTVDKHNPTLNEVLFRVAVGTTIQQVDTTGFPIIGTVTRPSYTDTRGLYISNSDHINISNNLIHLMPGGGLRVSESSYITIEENEIQNCSRRSYSGTHALVVTKAKPGTANMTDDTTYSIKVLRNIVRDNYNEVFSWVGTKDSITPRIDEGKGISLQRNNLAAWKSSNLRILVANNLCYWNGFSGAHSNDGWHIDFINNTCNMNSYTNTVTYANDQKGNNIGISAQGGDDIRIINNISVIDTDWGGFAISSGGTANLSVSDNLIFGTNGIPTQDPDVNAIDINTSISDPLFVNPITFNFALQQNSPAIGIANTLFSLENDLFDHLRDNFPDLGAIEYLAPLSIKHPDKAAIKVYPNPFQNTIAILSTADIHDEDIAIINILGQDMTKWVAVSYRKHEIQIDASKLPNGFYVIRAKNFTQLVNKQ
ncbi:MAG TPA: T9SS type A sorting domain-containing protein, partial [Bacteroidetes bacterium]|nr:T9SS type A sorting domain-containing protein [Bacteroidota bacterium]